MADILQQFRDRADSERVVKLGMTLDEVCSEFTNIEAFLALVGKLALMARDIKDDEARDIYLGVIETVMGFKGMREGGHRR